MYECVAVPLACCYCGATLLPRVRCHIAQVHGELKNAYSRVCCSANMRTHISAMNDEFTNISIIEYSVKNYGMHIHTTIKLSQCMFLCVPRGIFVCMMSYVRA